MAKYKIFLIIFIALLIRLYHINFPVAGWQSWRQADTAAIARNFYENDFKILYPQIDWRGNTLGYVESEFQIYPFITAVLYKIFGTVDTLGRVLSLLFSLSTIYGLYLLVRKFISEKVALWAAFIYSIIPLNIYYSRAFMPESAMLMCSVFSIYYFSEWIDRQKIRYFVLTVLLLSLAILFKIPSLYLGLPLVFLSWRKFGRSTFARWQQWLLAIIVMIPVALWYYHAHQLYLQTNLTFGIWGFGADKWGNIDMLLTTKFYNDVLFKSIAERHLTYAGFIPFLIGLFIRRRNKEERMFDWWLIAIIVYFFIVAKGNQAHEYYQLPFILPAVVFIAKTFAKYCQLDKKKEISIREIISTSIATLFLIGIFILSFLRYSNFMKSENISSPLFKLASSVQKNTKIADLIVAVDEGNPVILYRCNRKGWNSFPEQLDSIYIYQKVNLGAKYLLGEKSIFDSERRREALRKISRRYTSIINTDDYFIYKIY